MMAAMNEVDVPPGLQAGQTFQAQTASGIVTLTVPQNHPPGQKLQFQVAQTPQVVVVQPQQPVTVPVDPRTQPDDFPGLQVGFIAAVVFIGGFSSWIGACVNLCCRRPETEREAQAAWYTNLMALINLGEIC
jgi:hypothetical protein